MRWTLMLCVSLGLAGALPAEDTRPNILWITSEDNGPQLGCYGDRYATTPRLDALATKGMIYLNCWSNAPVCAPARTTIITGLYPPSIGAEHMRSEVPLPPGFRLSPQYLRQAGYYCTNNSKEDYNVVKPGQVWDESSGKAHWKNRQPGQPFFAVFNTTVSHESQVRKRPHQAVHDPAKVPLPAYHPDTPEVRQDWAQYHDNLTQVDAFAGKLLQELAEAGLAEETIVFYYGDHGPGLPRGKRCLYNSGLRVPLIVYLPEKFRRLASDYRPGGQSERLVSFVDLAPTLLSLTGIQPPEHFQGHAFMGKYAAAEQPYLYGYRARMDERLDCSRAVRNKRYLYIRNYMPHKPAGQFLAYLFETPTTQVWKKLYDAGQLSPPQTYFWEEKPTEELYDMQADPDQVRNLIDSPEHQAIGGELRQAHRDWELRIRDVTLLPEDQMHSRSEGSTPYELGHDSSRYPLERILEVAQLAGAREEQSLPKLRDALDDPDAAVRYWAALGALMQKQVGVQACQVELRTALKDDAPSVRIVAAQALAQYGEPTDLKPSVETLLQSANVRKAGIYVAVQALNALDELDALAADWRTEIQALPQSAPGIPARIISYVPRLLEKTLQDLNSPSS